MGGQPTPDSARPPPNVSVYRANARLNGLPAIFGQAGGEPGVRRTGQADFPHPALGQDFTPLLSRATPSAVSEHSLELIGCEPDKQISRIRLSDETSRLCFRVQRHLQFLSTLWS